MEALCVLAAVWWCVGENGGGGGLRRRVKMTEKTAGVEGGG